MSPSTYYPQGEVELSSIRCKLSLHKLGLYRVFSHPYLSWLQKHVLCLLLEMEVCLRVGSPTPSSSISFPLTILMLFFSENLQTRSAFIEAG